MWKQCEMIIWLDQPLDYNNLFIFLQSCSYLQDLLVHLLPRIHLFIQLRTSFFHCNKQFHLFAHEFLENVDKYQCLSSLTFYKYMICIAAICLVLLTALQLTLTLLPTLETSAFSCFLFRSSATFFCFMRTSFNLLFAAAASSAFLLRTACWFWCCLCSLAISARRFRSWMMPGNVSNLLILLIDHQH